MPVDLPTLAELRASQQATRAAFVTALFNSQQTPSSANDQALTQARSAMDTAQSALNSGIADWANPLQLATPEVIDTIVADYGRVAANLPIVCFPVRIETRFNGNFLQLRVFPDEIFNDSHEMALTPDEVTAAKAYYTVPSGQDATVYQQDQWRQMVQQFGSQRSAYVLRRMTPDANNNFPTDYLSRSTTWTRATEAVLPDRWVIMTRRGNATVYHVGKPIPEPVSTTGDPSAPPEQQVPLPNGYKIDRKILWTVDFQTAVDIGMALNIPLSADEASQGFDRIVVFGVKTSLTPADTNTHLQALFDAHHYTRGLALVAQGSVTNNTKDRPTAYPPKDEAGAQSFALERAHPPPDLVGVWSDTLPPLLIQGEIPPDAYFWSNVMGTKWSVLYNVDRANYYEAVSSVYSSQAMWPLTYRSFLKFLMDPLFTSQNIDDARVFASGAPPRGPSPAFRVGQVPYGLLPVTSLAKWKQLPGDSGAEFTVENAIRDPLRRLLKIWSTASKNVARVTPASANPDLDLISVLSLYPSSREVRMRFGFGGIFLYHLFNFLGWDVSFPYQALDQATIDLFQRLGHPEWRPRLGHMVYLPFSLLLTGPLVDIPKNMSETTPLMNNYIKTIFEADTALLDDSLPDKPNPEPLLYELLRIAALTEYAIKGDQLLLAAAVANYPAWINFEVFGIGSLPVRDNSIITKLGQPVPPEVSGNPNDQDAYIKYVRGQSFTYTTALGIFAVIAELVPSADIERLFTESLDVASHRLDPWVTEFATRRLLKLRGDNVHSSLLAGYGWVEDVRPISRTTGTDPEGNPVEVDPTNGGFIHCPSSSHAMAAAALRSGYLSYRGEDAQKYAVDLSSRRVRNATLVLDELRNGQHAGAVLGYRFERALQEADASIGNLNTLRFDFRNLYPLVAGKNGVDVSVPADHAAARNVVDGMALYRAHRAGEIPWGTNGLPAVGSAQYKFVVGELDQLVSLVDAVSDLLLAEGVYQVARGNVPGATSSLENLPDGGVPPNPDIARSPRSGVGLTHRVIYVFPSPTNTTPSLPPNWPAALTPRAAVDPVLNGWLGTILGDPNNVTALVNYDVNGAPATPITVKLSDLAIHPLDVLALARVVLQPNQGGLLDARVYFAANLPTTAANLSIDYSAPSGSKPAVDRTFPEVIELAGTLAATLGGSQPMGPADLVSPSDGDTATNSDTHAAEVKGRSDAAITALGSAITALQTATPPPPFDPSSATPAQIQAMQVAIRGAGAIAPERAFTTPFDTPASLYDLVLAVTNELLQRQTSLPTPPPASPAPTADDVVAYAQSVFKVVFGPDAFAMQRVDVPSGVGTSFGLRTTILDGDEAAPGRVLQQAMHGRAQLAKYRKFSLYARALGSPTPRLDVVQYPMPAGGEKWLALPFAQGSEPIESRSSLLLMTQGSQPSTTVPWRGIVVDSWVEVIPATKQPTSIAFNHNSPRAEAPQCVLVAVAPDIPSAETGWSPYPLVAILEETLDLAKVRGVDRELVDVGQLVPAIVLPNNLDQAITTSSGPLTPSASVPPIFSQGFI